MPVSVHRFAPTVAFLCGGLLIWAANFLLIYTIAAVACAKGAAEWRMLGMPFNLFVTVVSTVAAFVATAVLIWRAANRLRCDPDPDEHARFLRSLGLTIAAFALLAVAFNALPSVLMLGDCGLIEVASAV